MSDDKLDIFKDDIKGKIKTNLSGFFRAWLVSLLVILQFLGILFISLWLQSYTVYVYFFLELMSIIIIVVLVNDTRSASYKMAWICIALVLPITGQIMYALWGRADSKKKIEKNVLVKIQHGVNYLKQDESILEELEDTYPRNKRMVNYLISENYPVYKNNQLNYYPMGENVFEAIFKDLSEAKDFILIDFFIVAEGVLWDKMHEILLDRIKNGVKVMFLYDDFGAMLRTPKHFKRMLEAEGFQVRVFNPIHKYTDKLYMNYRSHQKIIVIDGNIGYTGGMNLADEYVNIINRFGKWKDNAVRVIGDAVWGLTVTFLQMWEVCEDGEFLDYEPFRPTMKFEESDVYCSTISDGPANNPNNPIESIYKQMIQYSERYLYITTPYLIIEDDMKDALKIAAKSGIDVRIITPNIPDKKNVKMLTNYNYGELLKYGVKIYEYTPGFIHAKTIINESCGIVGTINMDYRSFYLHYECGLWMSNPEIIQTIKEDLLKTMQESNEITYEEWKNRPVTLKIYQLFLNMFSTLM
ncbi:cardiolipin synthase [Anaeromicropila herbilytica]|uniref:Cardiolipin synthase n=1 Tax=Anaeromicropila herbilytica TaxID=2785025 RepID=A0A7R7EKJ3_9FIRM|nr:cardiolipin synthase [Anaeromicropila herbilytica]BCN30495.1 cardiolipin synthase [Anaeromicropila herbilytica]